MTKIRIVMISDTHNQHDKVVVPDGDILIHAGDATGMGTTKELSRFGEWFQAQPHMYKIIVPGNHDWGYEKCMPLAKQLVQGVDKLSIRVTVLHNESITVNVHGRDIVIYGSGSTPFFHNWSMNLHEHQLEAEWAKITPCDILVTHGPAHGILDLCPSGDRPGCKYLLKRIQELKPTLFVHGHIHMSYGVEVHGNTTFVNASTCNEAYKPVNPPIVLDI